MDMIFPSSLIAAVACAAGAGKNPWLPLGLLLLLAAPDSVPAFFMDPELHRNLHALWPEWLSWTLGSTFTVLAVADSLSDKVGFIQRVMVPLSTAWRPIAGVAVASLIAVAAARTIPQAAPMEPAVVTADAGAYWVGGSVFALTILSACVFTWIATISKTGFRLLTTLVPIPGVRLVHSFIDDFFAIGATFAGLAFGKSTLVVVLLGLYLFVGLWTGPLLTRLTWIHVRVGWSIVRKAWRKMEPGKLPDPPRWLARWMEKEGVTGTAFPAYVYRAPVVGRCRAGWLVVGADRVAFVSRIFWRPRALSIADGSLARIALADTSTARIFTMVERVERGALREVSLTLFPATEEEILPLLERAAEHAGLVRVKPDSNSARAGLPGWADRERSVRYVPASEAGDLRWQGVLTIVGAIVGGVLTGGAFVPIGLGYLFSPFKRRFFLGLLISGYLTICTLGSFGVGWPVCVLYASLLNLVALRDLTRHALRAKVDGFVDRRAWLPIASSRVWVGKSTLGSQSDRYREGDDKVITDGGWRAVVALLGEPDDPEPEPAAAA